MTAPVILTSVANAAVANLDANTVGSVAATAQSVPEAVTNAKAVSAFTNVHEYATKLGGEDTGLQVHNWNNDLSPDQRNMLVSAGFKTKPGMDGYVQQSGGGFWGDLGHIAGDIGHGIEDVPGVRQVIHSHGMHDVLAAVGKAANYGSAGILHGTRALDYTLTGGIAGNGDVSGGDLGGLRYLFDPEQWAHAWDATQNIHAVRPDVLRYVKANVDQFTYNILMATVNGETQAQILKSLGRGPKDVTLLSGSPDPATFTKEQSAYMSLVQGDNFNRWLSVLEDGQLDIGRVAAGELLFHANARGVSGVRGGSADKVFDLLSGAVDAGVDWGASPINWITGGVPLVGGLAKLAGVEQDVARLGLLGTDAFKVAHYAIGNAEDFRAVYDTEAGVRRAVDSVVQIMNHDKSVSFAHVLEAAPAKWHGFLKDMAEHQYRTTDQVIEYFSGDKAVQAIREGKAGRYYRDSTQWPHESLVEHYASQIKVAASDWIHDIKNIDPDKTPLEIARDNPKVMGFYQAGTIIPGASRLADMGLIGKARQMARTMTTLVPEGAINIADRASSATYVSRVASMGLQPWRAREITEMFLGATTEAEQRNIFRGLNKEVLVAMGLENTPEGREYIDEFDRMDQAYGMNNDAKRALDDLQTSTKMMTPDFKTLYRLSKKGWSMRALNGALNNDAFNAFMQKVWKPMMLMRYGFGVRVAGEEVLGSIFRDGVSQYLNAFKVQQIKRSLLYRIRTNTDPRFVRVFETWAASLPDETLKNLIEEAHQHFGEPARELNMAQRLLGHVFHNQYLQWAEATGMKHLVSDQDLTIAMQLAKEPRLVHGVVDRVSAYHDDERGMSSWETPSLGKKEERVAMRYSHVIERGKPQGLTIAEKQDYAGSAHYAWQGLQKGRVFRSVIDDMAGGTTDTRTLANRLSKRLSAPENHMWVQRMERHTRLDDGRQVGVDASQQDAHDEWARQAVLHVKATIGRRGGIRVPSDGRSIVDWIHEDHLPKTEDIAKMDWADMPSKFIAPELIDVPKSGMVAFKDRRMEGMLARPLNNIARQPMFFAKYKTAFLENQERLVRQGLVDQGAERAAARSAAVLDSQLNAEEWTRYRRAPQAHSGYLVDKIAAASTEDGRRAEESINSWYARNEWPKDYLKSAQEPVHQRWWQGQLKRLTGEHDYVVVRRWGDAHTKYDNGLANGSVSPHWNNVMSEDNGFEGVSLDVAEHGGAKREYLVKRSDIIAPGSAREGEVFFRFEKSDLIGGHTGEISGSASEETRVADQHLNIAAASKLAHEIAMERATSDMIPFIHNPALRSQTAILGRNLSPFYFAQEQQMKRWARTLKLNPRLVREGQLIMNGGRASGFLYTDPSDGQTYFRYPGTGFAFNVLNELTGGSNLGITSDMSSQVTGLLPGLNNFGMPALGPMVSIPLTLAAEHWPSISAFNANLLGPAGANESGLAQLLPTVVTRLIGAFAPAFQPSNGVGGLGNSTAKLNASIEAESYLVAAGKWPGQGANNQQIEAWSNLVAQWSTRFLLWRALLGFYAPGAPEVNIDPLQLDSKLVKLQNEGMPYNQALAVFLKEDPNGVPYTMAHTKVLTSGAYVAETEGTMRWIQRNITQLEKYPAATPWLIPSDLSSGPFSDTAYNFELVNGLRNRLGLDSWADQIQYKMLSNQYYDKQNQAWEAEQQVGTNYQADDAIRQMWAAWKAKFLDAHPSFATQLNSQEGHITRLNVIQQMTAMLQDPHTPLTKNLEYLRTLQENWNTWQQWMSIEGLTATGTIRWNVTQVMLDWGNAYAKEHPEIAAYWNGVLAMETSVNEGKG